jgi:hypothetical protein
MTTSGAWSLNQGIHWMVSLEYHKVYLEMDCKMVVDVNNRKPNQSEYNYNDFIVVFTRRQPNGSAHALARTTLSYSSRNTFDIIPNFIATIYYYE